MPEMPTDEQNQESQSVDAGGENTPKTPGQIADIQQSRDEQRKKNGVLSKENSDLRARLDKLEGDDAERTAADAAAKLKADEEAGQWQNVIGSKDKDLETVRGELADQKSKTETLAKQARQTGLVDAIAEQIPGASKFLVRAAVKELGATAGVDTAPETIDKEQVDGVIGKLKESVPSLFQQPGQRPPPVHGGSSTNQSGDHDRNDVDSWVSRMDKQYGNG